MPRTKVASMTTARASRAGVVGQPGEQRRRALVVGGKLEADGIAVVAFAAVDVEVFAGRMGADLAHGFSFRSRITH